MDYRITFKNGRHIVLDMKEDFIEDILEPSSTFVRLLRTNNDEYALINLNEVVSIERDRTKEISTRW